MKDTSCYKESEDRERALDPGIQKGQPGSPRIEEKSKLVLHTLVPRSLGATEFIAKFSTAGSIAGLCWHGLNPWRVWRFGWCRPFHHMRNVTVFIEALLRRTLLTARNDRWRPSGNEGDLVSRGASAKKKGRRLVSF